MMEVVALNMDEEVLLVRYVATTFWMSLPQNKHV